MNRTGSPSDMDISSGSGEEDMHIAENKQWTQQPTKNARNQPTETSNENMAVSRTAHRSDSSVANISYADLDSDLDTDSDSSFVTAPSSPDRESDEDVEPGQIKECDDLETQKRQLMKKLQRCDRKKQKIGALKEPLELELLQMKVRLSIAKNKRKRQLTEGHKRKKRSTSQQAETESLSAPLETEPETKAPRPKLQTPVREAMMPNTISKVAQQNSNQASSQASNQASNQTPNQTSKQAPKPKSEEPRVALQTSNSISKSKSIPSPPDSKLSHALKPALQSSAPKPLPTSWQVPQVQASSPLPISWQMPHIVKPTHQLPRPSIQSLRPTSPPPRHVSSYNQSFPKPASTSQALPIPKTSSHAAKSTQPVKKITPTTVPTIPISNKPNAKLSHITQKEENPLLQRIQKATQSPATKEPASKSMTSVSTTEKKKPFQPYISPLGLFGEQSHTGVPFPVKKDKQQTLCSFETGGGTCNDDTCTALHFRDFGNTSH